MLAGRARPTLARTPGSTFLAGDHHEVHEDHEDPSRSSSSPQPPGDIEPSMTPVRSGDSPRSPQKHPNSAGQTCGNPPPFVSFVSFVVNSWSNGKWSYAGASGQIHAGRAHPAFSRTTGSLVSHSALPSVRVPSKIEHGSDHHHIALYKVDQTVREPPCAAAPQAVRNPPPCFRLHEDTTHGALHLFQKLQTQPRGRSVVVLDRLSKLSLGRRQEPVGHRSYRPRSSRNTVGPSIAAISPRRCASIRASASATQAASTATAASSSKLPISASAKRARCPAGSRKASRSRMA